MAVPPDLRLHKPFACVSLTSAVAAGGHWVGEAGARSV